VDRLRPFTLIEPGICHKTTRNPLAALQYSPNAASAFVVMTLADGMLEDAPREYPLTLLPLYAGLPPGGPEDKRVMEAELTRMKPTGEDMVVRPSALGSGLGQVTQTLREGTIAQSVQDHGNGRDDVGSWICSDVEDRSVVHDRGFHITY
ncbi:hypothetical protein LTR91_024003, partial [Friedmanniomyces endolithicus]